VAAYLSGHGVAVTTHLLPSPGSEAAEVFLQFARRAGADLIVMGAYGHTRLREWIFGGATRDILQATALCCLMSH
jgi:nucleotide-binding universal stress UspA family protein